MVAQRYKLQITPLETDSTYSDAVDVTDFVIQSNSILRQVDDGDFDIGVFTFDSVKIRLLNDTGDIQTSGRFWDVNSPSSIFKYKRDKAKVKIIYVDDSATEYTQFEGLIDDSLTLEDFDAGYTDIEVISMGGIFNKQIVLGGSVRDGVTVTTALESLLNRPIITNYLTYNSANINPPLNPVVDFGQKLDNLTYKEALDKLMLICGGVLLIDDNNNIIVKDRTDNGNTAHAFYNAGDPLGRDNIIRLADFNNGFQRAFNKIEIDETSKQDDISILDRGIFVKQLAIKDYITNEDTREAIIDYYLDNFATPKLELQIQVETDIAKEVDLLDLCSVSYLPVLKPSITGEAFSFPDNMPIVLNKRYINGNIGFKVIAKQVNLKDFTTTLKLREIGKRAGDSNI